jgi:hypothetical protein
MDVLRRHGFTPCAAHPYDPLRIVRSALRSFDFHGGPRRAIHGMGGLDGPPMPPTLGRAPAKPGRSIDCMGGLDGPPKPPTLVRAPAKPGRSSISVGAGGSALRDAVRALFYTPPALRLLGHMLLVVAVKA